MNTKVARRIVNQLAELMEKRGCSCDGELHPLIITEPTRDALTEKLKAEIDTLLDTKGAANENKN